MDTVRQHGVTDAELATAKRQLKARLVFDSDSITNIAHQLGYFETIGGVDAFLTLQQRIASVTVEEVATAVAATFSASNRTIGWFDPLPVGNGSRVEP
jgi:predicted Zn-dependent peptidase